MTTSRKQKYLLFVIGIGVVLFVLLGFYGGFLRRYIQRWRTPGIAGQQQLVQTLLKAGKFTDAQAILEQTIAAEKALAQPDPQIIGELFSLLASAENEAGKYSQAVEAQGQAVAWDEKSPLLPPQVRREHLKDLALLTSQASPDKELVLMQELFEQCELPPKDEACAADAAFQAGFILSLQLNRDDEALAWLRRSVLMQPNAPIPGYFLARAEANVAEAKRDYSQAAKDLLEMAKYLQESTMQSKPVRLSHIYTQLARDYAASGQKRKARYYDEQARSLSQAGQAR